MNRKGSMLLGLGVFIWIVYKVIDTLLMPVPNGLAFIFVVIAILFVIAGWVQGRKEKS